MSEYKNISQKDYWLLHAWLRRNYGKANKCSNANINCNDTYEWALIKGKKYDRNIENFIMLCNKCHYIYDERDVNGPLHPMYGKKHTKETKEKMRLARLGKSYCVGYKHSDETKKKMSEARKGVPKSEEHKKKLSLAHKKNYQLSPRLTCL